MVVPWIKKRSIQKRPKVSIETWFQKNYPAFNRAEQKHAEEVLLVVSKAIRVDATQLLPSDSITRDYCRSILPFLCNDNWEAFTSELAEYVARTRGKPLSPHESALSDSWLTLDDMIKCVVLVMKMESPTDTSIIRPGSNVDDKSKRS